MRIICLVLSILNMVLILIIMKKFFNFLDFKKNRIFKHVEKEFEKEEEKMKSGEKEELEKEEIFDVFEVL